MSIFERSFFFADSGAALVARAAIFLTFSLPTLLSAHPRPLPAFAMEVVLALLLFLGMSMSPAGKRAGQVEIFIPLASAVLLCSVLSGGGEATWAYASYILLFLVAYCYGTIFIEGDDRAVAYGLVACAFLQSIVIFMQVFAVGVADGISPLMGGRATGNVGHPNLLSDLLLLGLAALCHPAFDRLKRFCRPFLALWLGFAVAATGSRSAWLGIVVFCVIGFFCRIGRERNAGLILPKIALIVAAAQFLFPFLRYFGVTSVDGGVMRDGTQGSNDARWYLAQISWNAVKDSPWFGHGAGSFWRVSADALQVFPVQAFQMLGENAHNLPLNLAVEFGLPVSMLVCAALLYWGYSRLRTLNPERGWALACVGVVFAHSLVEYPLWYSFLMVPCALCMGIVDAERPAWRSIRLPAKSFRVAALIGLLACLVMVMDWMHVRLAWLQLSSASEMTARVMSLSARDELEQVSRFSVFGQQVGSLRLQSFLVGQDDLGLALRDCEENWKERPTWFMLKSCGEIFSAARHEDSLRQLVNVQCKGYPSQHALLHDWAAVFDSSGKGLLKLAGRTCL